MSSTMSTVRNDSSWINVAKACAIVGVVIQHSRGLLYTDMRINYSTWWTVALFIVVGGYNAMSSYENRGYVVMKRRLLGIGIPYVVATILYQIYVCHELNFYRLCLQLIHFNASGPLYYVAVYLQLVLVTPVLIAIIRYCETKNITTRYLIAWVLIIGVCLLVSKKTNVFDIAIGGGRLFAGPWLFFWFAGMFIRQREGSIRVFIGRVPRIAIYTILLVLWEYFFVIEGHNLDYGPLFRHSGVGMTWANTLETFIFFFWFKDLIIYLESKESAWGQKIIKPFNYLGRHTLHIFLYHILFVSMLGELMLQGGALLDNPLSFLGLAFVVLMPVALEIGMGKAKNAFKEFMAGVKIG